jgi:hypothetical protein
MKIIEIEGKLNKSQFYDGYWHVSIEGERKLCPFQIIKATFNTPMQATQFWDENDFDELTIEVRTVRTEAHNNNH